MAAKKPPSPDAAQAALAMIAQQIRAEAAALRAKGMGADFRSQFRIAAAFESLADRIAAAGSAPAGTANG